MWTLSRISVAICTLLVVAALALYGITVRSTMKSSNRRFFISRNPFNDRPVAKSPKSPPLSWTFDLENDCTGSSINASVRRIKDFNGVDWHIYSTFASMNVTSPKNLELLSSSARADIAKEVGLASPVAERVFKLCHSFVKSFNRCHYKLLSDPGPCTADASATSVIVVHSLPASSQRRLDIRARMNQLHLTGYRLVFLLGRTESVQTETEVQKEAALHHDIIWADFFEDYDNLTIKTLVMLRWMEQNCLLAKYLVKADDDVYLKMSNLHAVLTANVNSSRIIVGAIGYGEGVYRQVTEKWYMPMYMFSRNTYPPFAHGPSYVISTDLIADINKAALKIDYMHLEDIFVAVCASTLANVHHVHVPSFISGSCSVPEAVALHGLVCT